MRTWALLLLAATNGSAACLIHGSVVDAASHKPLPKSRVFAKPVGNTAKPAIFQATDDHGAFCFERLEAGQYEVAVTRAGYLPAVFGAKPGGKQGLPLNVDGLADLPPLKFQLLPAAAIGGSVLDANGEPREGAEVELDRKGWDKGWSPDWAGRTYSDDRGAFRFPMLAPGTYYLSVSPAPLEMGDGRQFLDEKGRPIRTAEAVTFYNGSLTFARATPVPLQAGQQNDNLVVTLEKVARRHLAGRLGPSVQLEEPVRIHLNPRNSAPSMQIDVARDRTFSVDGLLPAKYRIYVTGSGSQAGEIPDVDLTGGDVDGFVAEPTPVFDLRVSARMEDAAAMVPAQLEAFDLERGSGRTGRLETGGVYPFRLSPGIYRLEARRADRVFVKGVSINGQPMPDVLLDLRKGTPGTVEAILSPHVASLEGRLDRPDGELPTLAIAVVLMDETASRTQVEGEQVTVDHSGKFKLESLAPGKYRLFAIEGFEESLWGSLELAAALREKSLALELHEGETRAVAVPVITFDAWTAALRKVGM